MPSGGELVVLPGPAMVELVRAVGVVAAAKLGRFAVVGGVAVTTRLATAHRATVDVDAVVEEGPAFSAVEALLTTPGTMRDPERAQRVWIHGTKVELLGVAALDDRDLEGIPANDALFVASHAWALDTATHVTVATGGADGVQATAPFATPAALVATKLHAIEDRRPAGGVDKRVSDAFDIYRLLVDLDGDGAVRGAFGEAPPTLRALVRAAAERVLVTNAGRMQGWLRQGDPTTAAVTADELRYLGRPLVESLTG